MRAIAIRKKVMKIKKKKKKGKANKSLINITRDEQR